MKPTIGRIIHYTLTAEDAEKINASRKARNESPAAEGTQEHRGNQVAEGAVVPAIVTAAWGGTEELINGQALLDGIDSFWLLSRPRSEFALAGFWNWPSRE